MKSRTYKNESFTCKAYFKNAGRGYEVGFIISGKPVFVGNFVYLNEASRWYQLMNREIKTFSRRHPVGKNYPKSWYSNYMKTHLYTTYYKFLDKVFTKHQRIFAREYKSHDKKYTELNRKWNSYERRPFLKAA